MLKKLKSLFASPPLPKGAAAACQNAIQRHGLIVEGGSRSGFSMKEGLPPAEGTIVYHAKGDFVDASRWYKADVAWQDLPELRQQLDIPEGEAVTKSRLDNYARSAGYEGWIIWDPATSGEGYIVGFRSTPEKGAPLVAYTMGNQHQDRMRMEMKDGQLLEEELARLRLKEQRYATALYWAKGLVLLSVLTLAGSAALQGRYAAAGNIVLLVPVYLLLSSLLRHVGLGPIRKDV